MPSCTGNRLNTAGTCDGLGTCRAPGVENCHPFRCVDGACTNVVPDRHRLRRRRDLPERAPAGRSRSAHLRRRSECASGFCVDGVCCESACSGTCQLLRAAHPAPALPDRRGRQRRPARRLQGQRRRVLRDRRQVRRHRQLREVRHRAPSARAKSADRPLHRPVDLQPHRPVRRARRAPLRALRLQRQPVFQHLRRQRSVQVAQQLHQQLVRPEDPPARPAPATPSAAPASARRASAATRACDGKCQSCALNNTQGTCTNVPAGSVDPTAPARTKGPPPAAPTASATATALPAVRAGDDLPGSTCPTGTTTFTGASTCDGAGKCVTPNASPCFPYQCGAGVCKNSCTADFDCAPPAVCINGSCGLKGNGQACAAAAECLSGFCAQGVCCGTACQGACQSCALATSLGTCTNVPFGASDPQGTCHDMGNATCGTDGFCNGSGACRLYAAATPCAPPSCPATSATLTSGRTCDGKGTCQAATNIPCAPFVCNGTRAARRPARRTPTASPPPSAIRSQSVRQQEAPRSGLRVDGRLPDREHLR